MISVKLKVCGITSLADAQASIACGAEYLGFNFYRPSPRFIEPAAARAIILQLPEPAIPVGIFVNEARPADVRELMNASGVSLAQLHGDESADYCRSVGAERVIKAFRVGQNFALDGLTNFPASAILLDAYDKQLYGGTGQVTDWKVAAKAAKVAKIFLAGGLAPENILEAVQAARPFAVDVNSGVERAPGQKDAARLRLLKQVLGAVSYA